MQRTFCNSYMTLGGALSLALAYGCSGDGAATKADTDSVMSDDAGAQNDSGQTEEGAAAPAVPDELSATGPITGGKGKPFTATAADLGAAGYTEKEFFFEGVATAYEVQGEMTEDGMWMLNESTKAPFRSRLLVRRPEDAGKFNGTVVVEWLNVSGGADGDPGFVYSAEEILRGGYAWVGVSTQAVGIQGGGLSLGSTGALPLKQDDPERYGTLIHPGDIYSYDIFSLAAKVIRDPSLGDVLEGLEPERLIAYGESQSAIRLVSYVDGVHPLAGQFDGFFIHSRSASGAPFTDDPLGGLSLGGFGGGTAHHIRADLGVPVFQFQTETDVTGMLGYLAARQPDSGQLRTWEAAGTSHADQHILDFNASLMTEGSVQCDGANDGPAHYLIKAGLHWLNLWIRDGSEPPMGEPLATNDDGSPKVDEHGNSLGGVRSPDVDVPIATLSGASSAGGGSLWCFLFGSTTPFSADELMKLYPTHEDYVMKVKASAAATREAGFILEPEEALFVQEAEAAQVPK